MDLFRFTSVIAWTVMLSGAMTLAACGDDPDAGPKDNGVPSGQEDGGNGEEDAGEPMDATSTDRGRNDAGRPDMGVIDPCPNGAEGCECTSTATAAKIPFIREDCQEGLLCVPWDLITPNPNALDGPVKSCVKPCENDGECGAGRFCANMGFIERTGAEKFCVDKRASYDEFCSGSRLDYESVTDPAVKDGTDQMIGCEDGLDCELFQFGGFNPDEALCAKFCNTDADCTHPQLPHCNPRLFTSNSTTTPFVGVCSTGPKPSGSICGSPDTNKPFFVSTRCDTSEESCGPNLDACPTCIGIPFNANTALTPEGTGLCLSTCTAQTPCFGTRTCVEDFFRPVPPATVGDGVCSDGCTSIPDTCGGTGTLDHGQDCLEFGDAAWCVDRYQPSLMPATVDGAGNITAAGEDCTGDFNAYSWFSCPDNATCVPQTAPNPGLCVFGCVRNDPMFGGDYCKTIMNSQTATCTRPAQAMFDVCGG